MESRLCRKTQAHRSSSREVTCRVYMPGSLLRAKSVPQWVPVLSQGQQLHRCTNSFKLQSYQVAGRDFFFFNRNNSIVSGIYLLVLSLNRHLDFRARESFSQGHRFLSKIMCQQHSARVLRYAADHSIVAKGVLRHILVFWFFLSLFITKFKMLHL